jgi:hypothetical protein
MCNPIESPSPSPPLSTEDIPLPPHHYSKNDSTYNPLKDPGYYSSNSLKDDDPNYNSFEDDKDDDEDDEEYPDYEESDQQLSYDGFIKKLQDLIQELHIQLAFTQCENGELNDKIRCLEKSLSEERERSLKKDQDKQIVIIRYLRPKRSRS